MKKTILTISFLVGYVPIVFADSTTPAATATQGHGGGLGSLVMFGAIFAMMYFLMIRPQSKRAKEHRNMLAAITKDDEVVTQGGMVGKIVRDVDGFFIIAISDNVEIPVQKQSVIQVLPKGTLKTIC